MKYALCFLAGCIVAFGCVALYLGHDSVVISSVFAGVGGIAGYLVGQKISSAKDSED